MLALKLDAKAFSKVAGKVIALEILSVVSKALRRFGEIPPFVLIQRSDGQLLCVDLPEDKESWKNMLESFLCKTGASRYFVVSVAWACTLPMGDPSKGVPVLVLPVHQNPLRYEIVWVAAIERTGDCVMVEQRFVRDRNGIKLFKPVCRHGDFASTTLPTHWGSGTVSPAPGN